MGYEVLCQEPMVDEKLVQKIFPFCVPEGEKLFEKQKNGVTRLNFMKEETFEFILTEVDLGRSFVLCRRFAYLEYPECFCIISKSAHEELFKKIFEKASYLRMISMSLLHGFIKDIAKQYKPEVNGVLRNIDFVGIPYEFSTSELSSEQRILNVTQLLFQLGSSIVVDLVGELLLERKFLFVSNDIEKLTETVFLLTSLIHPFTWQVCIIFHYL